MDLSGDLYLALDEEALGDGESDTLPLDVYVEQRTQANGRFLAAGHNSCTLTFTNSNVANNANTGDRPWAAVSDISVFYIPFRLEKGLSKIVLSGLYNVQSESSSPDQGDVFATVELEGVESWTFDFANTDNAGSPDYTAFRQELELSEVYEGPTVSTRLALWVRSEWAGEAYANYTPADSFKRGIYFAKGTFTFPANGPTSNSFETMAVRGNVRFYFSDIIAIDPADDAGDVHEIVYLDRDHPEGSTSYYFEYLGYLQLRHITLELEYNKTSTFFLSRDAIRAQRLVESLVPLSVALQAIATHRRSRIVGFGPGGKVYGDADEQWPGGYAQRWPYVVGDAAAEPDTILLDEVLFLDKGGELLELELLLGAFVLQAGGGELGEVRWDLTLDVEQLEAADPDWSSAASRGSTARTNIPFPLWPTSPVESQLQATVHYTISQGLYQLEVPGSTPSAGQYDPIGFSYKEGSIFRRDAEARKKILAPFTLAVDLSGVDLSSPVRLKLTAEITSGTTPIFPSTFGQDNNERIRLICFGWTALESSP